MALTLSLVRQLTTNLPKHRHMIDPSKILATKITKAGAMVLVLVNGKRKWVWRDKEKPKPNSMEEFLSR